MNLGVSDTLLAVSPKTFGRPELENTGKILLHESILDRIMKIGNHQEIMLFLLRNPHSQQGIAAGVESFTSDRASVVMPEWMMKSIDISESDKVQILFQKYPRGTSVTFQPFQSEFFQLPNFRVILEHDLRAFPCFTQGSVIPVVFLKQVYKLKVLKVEPEKIVSCYHTDISTEFASALDTFDHKWGEEEDEYVPPSEKARRDASNPAFQGPSHSLKPK
ncbi:hypothetical protein M9Y10_034249 [Tritrichomonas musculus]|uniref:Uncharacterized protein n=1 Tax=Tritrichomonas musculus TaxID=1915356 RepID=A0ABR2KF45_9EUKA